LYWRHVQACEYKGSDGVLYNQIKNAHVGSKLSVKQLFPKNDMKNVISK